MAYRLSLSVSHIQKTIMSLIMVFSLYPTISFALSPVSGFSVEPAVMHASVAEESIFSSTFTLKNLEDQSLSVRITVADFEPLDEGVGVRELEHTVSADDPLFASGWVSFPKEPIIIAPKKKLSVPFSIRVPKDAVPGAKSFTFVIETLGGNVHSRVYLLCFLNVPGDAKEILTIEDVSFHFPIYNAPRGTLSLQIKNNGETHIRPDGMIVVRNMFGVERGRYLLTQSDAIGTLVPGARRTIDYVWSGNAGVFDFGLWNARVTLTYGNGNVHEVSDRAFVLLFPVLSVSLFVCVVSISALIIVRSIRLLKKDMHRYAQTPFTSEEHRLIEQKTSARLLVVPLLAGLVLVIIVVFTLASLLGNQDAGKMERAQKVYSLE